MKSKNIKRILKIVKEENLSMLNKIEDDSIKTEEEDMKPKNVINTSIILNQEPILSLDHLHLLSTPVARQHLESLPGIGSKTAACVLMFCMQRDVFPVDTHVWRLCKWLGWTKEGANRDATYLHCGESRISMKEITSARWGYGGI